MKNTSISLCSLFFVLTLCSATCNKKSVDSISTEDNPTDSTAVAIVADTIIEMVAEEVVLDTIIPEPAETAINETGMNENPPLDSVPPQRTDTVKSEGKRGSDKAGFSQLPTDPMGTWIYTLKNGLKVYMSVNKDEPRITTRIAVRAGSKNDPSDATGLAHYLEHMVFKGTSRLGALKWEEEKVLLQQISDLYEAHRNETDDEKRKAIYAQIDSTSQQAAKLVSFNEYDDIVSSMGVKGTNAYTSVEQTVYINDIPSNELGRWLDLESERFSELVLRLFHTELEAVYEEYNIGQDQDGRQMYMKLLEALFPEHTYGTQTTIGTGEHLKNPSMVKIHEFFNTYYVPNNMAIILSGDLDPERAVELVEKYWGEKVSKEVPEWTFKDQPAITSPIVEDVFGQEKERLYIGFRTKGDGTRDELITELIAGILSNGRAGLMDISLNQKQKVTESSAWSMALADYSVFGLDGQPREGQSLEELKDLLLAELSKVRNGEFEEWLLPAVVKDKKLKEMRQMESNAGRAGLMTNAFLHNLEWSNIVGKYDRMEKFTKQDVIDYVKQNYNDNYVVVYKRIGEKEDQVKVQKPVITPLEVNRDNRSPYFNDLMKQTPKPLAPEFVDFDQAIEKYRMSNDLYLDYIKNETNGTFSLYYIFEMGRRNNPLLPIAIEYLPYLGTNKYSAERLQQEFFRLGLEFQVFSGEDRCYVTLRGLDESLAEGVKLFEHILSSVKPEDEPLKGLIGDIIKKREDGKKSKQTILREAMVNYAKYGPNSPFTDKLSKEELQNIQPQQLIELIKGLSAYEHRIFYYGSQSKNDVARLMEMNHKVPMDRVAIPEAKEYPELETDSNVVIFVDFEMVQAELLMLSKGKPFNMEEYKMSNLYNNYFGYGMSAVVFQEIRESKALAYSCYAAFSSPSKPDQSHYMQAYVGTQVDKLKDAVTAMQEIIENMPVAENKIENAKTSIIKKMDSERITNSSIYWKADGYKKLGYQRDLRKDIYDFINKATPQDLVKFQEEHVKGRSYTYLVLGSKEKVDMEFLKSIGTVKEVTLEEIFGFE